MSHLDQGQGTPVVLLHGFGNDHLLWRAQLAGLSPLHRIVAPDLRGFGAGTPTNGQPVSMDEYADDIVALLDSLRIERAVIGGISLGGYVALSLALRHPSRVLGLVLANTRAIADTPAQQTARNALAADIAKRGPQAVVDAFGDKPLRPDCDAAVKAEIRAMYLRQPATGMISGVLGMRDRPDRTGSLMKIDAPTLVVTGTADIFIPPSESEPMHRCIDGSSFVNLQGAGHLSNIDSPAAFNAAVGTFLAGLQRRQGT